MENRLDNLVINAFEQFDGQTYLVKDDFQMSYNESYKKILSIKRNIDFILRKYNYESVLVAILCEAKLPNILSILSCLISKNVYVPLDNQGPINRNINIINENDIPVFIISKSFYNHLSKSKFQEKEKLYLPEIDAYLLVLDTKSTVKKYPDLAYVLFTSGSTGKPKGIQITHSNALAFVLWSKKLIVDNHSQKFCSIAPFQFDLSVFDIYVPLLSGNSLFLFENEEVKNPRLLTQQIDKYEIQILYTTPTVYHLILSYGKIKKRKLSSLSHIIFAGEVMTFDILNQLKSKCQDAKYYNFYGPTETNVCTFFDATNVEQKDEVNVPIGSNCPYVSYRLDFKNGDDNKGELLISGNSVFKGYLNNQELTKKKIKLIDSERWYATGDIVQKHKNGTLSYLSRADRMVKYNGYRIELNEIENVILRLDHVAHCAVILNEIETEKHIFAYVEMRDQNDNKSIERIKEHCIQYLPHYMIPSNFKIVDQLPLNANSKVDYKILSQWKN